MPHVLVEKGDMTLGEYDQHLKGKADFIRGTKKDSSAERKVSLGWQSWAALGTWSHRTTEGTQLAQSEGHEPPEVTS